MNAWAYDENAIMLLKSLIPRKGELVRTPGGPDLSRPSLGEMRGLAPPPGLGDLVKMGPGTPLGPLEASRGLSQSPLMIRCKYIVLFMFRNL